ncbi:hypothetical protein AeMF1_005418 [Aphanomyces euteiches]|nr:hypothetical protein AeMF1_005418 [Aphanomyces euteiches]
MIDTSRGRYRRYSNRERKDLLLEFHATHGTSDEEFRSTKGIPRSPGRTWRAKQDKILQTKQNGKKATLGGQGRKPLMPFEAELLEYMRARRAEERYLRIFHLMNWVKKNQHEWLTSYVDSKTSQEKAYDSLRRLLCRFCERYRFTQRVPCVNKVLQSVLEEVWLGYAAHFWSKYSDYPPSRILNADETGVYFDMPPGKTYAEIGQSSKVDKSSKQSERISVVLTIRADGVKLPLLFIVKGQPGGLIEGCRGKPPPESDSGVENDATSLSSEFVTCILYRYI